MKRRELILSLPALPLAAQSRQERGKKAVDEAIEALGGQRFLEMRDRIEAGRVYSFFREQLSGLARARIYTRYLTRPAVPSPNFFGLRERQSFGKDQEDYAVLFNENEGWQITYRGARPLGKEAEERFRDSTRRNIFYILRMRLGEPGMLIEHEGTDVWENQPVQIVSITDSENKTVRVFFHSSTKLPVKQEYVRRDERTRERFEELTRFSKYRDVRGVQWPYQIQRERNGEKVFEIFSERVTINNDLKDDLFTLPANTKILPPAR
ncbi:MAG: hypothetical protein NZV14_16680 [Bryobacteraceae bacterium]|nr:hypothetical protein [Bryobacteraceae bacterium]MDW8379797.1 hypothetical protein [Bryobacterales bacterium]